MPSRFWTSPQLTVAAAVRIRTSLGPGAGVGTSPRRRTSIPPGWSTTTALMVDSPPMTGSPLRDRRVVVPLVAVLDAQEIPSQEGEHRRVECPCRDLGDVAIRVELDEVDRGDARILTEDEQGLEEIRRMNPIRGRGRRSRGVSELKDVDIDGDVDRVRIAAGDLDRLTDRLFDAGSTDRPGGHDRSAFAFHPPLVVARVHEAVDADLDQVLA